MSHDQAAPPASPSSRRSSASSRSFAPSGLNEDPAVPTTPRFPAAPRETSISMFTPMPQSPTAAPSKPATTSSVLSPGSINRVFPVRSAVSIDPYATPAPRQESIDGFPGMNLHIQSNIAERRSASQSQSEKTSGSITSNDDRRSSTSETSRNPPARKSSGMSLSSIREDQHSVAEEGRQSSISVTGEPLTEPPESSGNQSIHRLLSDAASGKSDVNSSTDGGVALGTRPASIKSIDEPGSGLMTARFKHIVSEGGHTVITGRDGDVLQRCEDEPIHIPGAVQSFGLLVAFKEVAGKLVIRVVSENSVRILGFTPAQLFRLESFLDIFTEEQADNLIDHLDFIRDDEAADVVANGPEVFMVSVKPPQQRTRKLWCAMHICESDREMVICEFEIEDDTVNPLVHPGDGTPEPPEDTLGSDPTPEEYAESTTNISKPLRVLRSARKKRGEAAAMEVFNILSQVQEQLANAKTLPIFLKVLIGVIKELTGFHRVMIYQFDQSWNGRVVAELVDPRATRDMYKGLNFPASDIPKQARDLYKLNKVRLLYDRDQETARLVCRTTDDLEKPLDLTHAYLRAMSPIHIKYLGNMAVRSSMSVSINAFDELWGLVACHTYGSRGMRVSFPIRKMCRLVGDTASRNIERLSYASRLQARKLINTASSAVNPSGYIVASSDDLLKLFDADVGALSIRDETKIMGKEPQHLQEILAMVEFLRLRKLTSVCTSPEIHSDFPDLRYEPGLKFLAGMLYVPLSSAGTDFIVFFRRGVLQEVKWAGNPYEKFIKEGTEGYLEPRKSFKTWCETITGRCRDWTAEEIETASVLCLVYGKFIDVWRQKEAALQNSQLTRLLLANSAHEVRTPLNAIINYLEIALEGQLDQETRDNLAKSHSASKSLVYVINDLLDLTKTEDGQDLVKDEVFNLKSTLREATTPFAGDAKRKNIEYAVHIAADIPNVVGDHRRVRQIVSNLVANAIQHTTTGRVTMEGSKSTIQPSPDKIEIEISVEDTGVGMSQSKVDALFRELEEVSLEPESQGTSLVAADPFADRKVDDDKAPLGLGLAVVARTIRNMNGQLRLKTEEGKGSRFVIQLTFEIETVRGEGKHVGWQELPALQGSSGHMAVRTPPVEAGEILLVDRNLTAKRPSSAGMIRKTSRESVTSLKSLQSQGSYHSAASQRSDVDRLIDAIQEPIHSPSDTPDYRKSGHERRTIRSGSTGQEEGARMTPKSRSIGSTRDLRSSLARIPGEQKVKDSAVPIKAVKLEPAFTDSAGPSNTLVGSEVVFREPGAISDVPESPTTPMSEGSTENFHVLVAEDDPVNSRIIQKRLEKLGHRIHLTVNGEECAQSHGDLATSYDAVLMDLQMPIVDGFTSTKMIRSFEKTSPQCLSPRAALNGRIPIFAVSASLVERERQKYIDCGFDGWILKPVDFKRTELLLRGIVDEDIRHSCIYEPGKWEQGGWFTSRQQTPLDVDTRPQRDRMPSTTYSAEGDSGSDTTQRPIPRSDNM